MLRKLTTSCPLCSVRPKLVNSTSIHMLLLLHLCTLSITALFVFVFALILFACLYVISVLIKMIIFKKCESGSESVSG